MNTDNAMALSLCQTVYYAPEQSGKCDESVESKQSEEI